MNILIIKYLKHRFNMGRLYRASDKAKLKKNVLEYKRRRNILRERWGIVNGRAVPEGYTQAAHNLNTKIKVWKNAMDAIDKRNNQLLAISNAMSLFLGVNVKNSNLNTAPRWKLGRFIFYKYCLEVGLSATLVAEFTGASTAYSISRARRSFTASFANNPSNREMYYRFKTYIEDYLTTKTGE
jgi:hypothetical protein